MKTRTILLSEVNLGYKHVILISGYSFRQMNFKQTGGKK
jgi:hypothetical protein